MAQLSERVIELLKQKEKNDLRIKYLEAHAKAAPGHLKVLRAKVEYEKSKIADWNRALGLTKETNKRMQKFSETAERSNEVLRKCDELLARTAGWQHPLFEKKKAALERCKKQYADFREKIDQSEPVKENTALKADVVELKQKLTAAREQKNALIEESEALKERANQKRNALIVKIATEKLAIDGKEKELQNEKSKTAILQTESEKSKRNVEIKEMDLVVWKKRHDNIVAEKRNFHLPKLEYIDFQHISLEESSYDIPSPTESECSVVCSPVKSKVIGNDQTPQGNQINDPCHDPTLGASAMVPPRQSVIKPNPNQVSTTAPKATAVYESSQPTSNTTLHSVDVPSLADGRNIGHMWADTERKRKLGGSSTTSARASDETERNKRPKLPVEHTTQIVRPEEQSPHAKTKSPKDRSDAKTTQVIELPSSAGNPDISTNSRSTLTSAIKKRAANVLFDSSVPPCMPAQIRKTSALEQKTPTFSDEKRPAQFDPMSSKYAMNSTDKTASSKDSEPPVMNEKQSLRSKPTPSKSSQVNAESHGPNLSGSSANTQLRSQSSSSSSLTIDGNRSSTVEFQFSQIPKLSTKDILQPPRQISGGGQQKSRKRILSNELKKTSENADFKKPKTSAPNQEANSGSKPPSSSNDSLFGFDDALFSNVDRPTDDFEFNFDDGPSDMAANFGDDILNAPNINNESDFNFDFPNPGEPFDYNADGNATLTSPDEVIGSNDFNFFQ